MEKGTKVITLDLNKIYTDLLHAPKTRSGFTLYPRAEGYQGDMENGGNLTLAEQDPEYIEASKKYYNSPTNIRKVFITGSRIIVQYYAVPQGSESIMKHTREKAVPDSEDLLKRAGDILRFKGAIEKYNRELAMYEQSKLVIKNAKKPEPPVRYKVVRDGIGIINGAYKCNNIEEIYMDWTVFLSEEVRQFFSSMGVNPSLVSFYKKEGTFNETVGNQCLEFFKKYACKDAVDFRKSFPRLRTIAIITNLEDIVKSESMQKVDERFRDLKAERWYDVNRQLIASSRSSVLISRLDDINWENKEFNIKEYYKFDSLILKPLIQARNKAIDELLPKVKTGEELSLKKLGKKGEEIDESITLGDVEARLMEIEKQCGDLSKVKSIMLCALDGIGINDIKSVINQFRNKEKYKKLIGIQ